MPARRPHDHRGGTTTARRGTLRSALALLVVAGTLVAAPALADTESRLEAAKSQYQSAKARLAEAVAAWQAAEARYAQTVDELVATRATIERLQRRLVAVQAQLAARARLAYMNGVGGTIELLLSSSTFTEFSDRLEFVGSIAEADVDLITEGDVTREELRWQREDLARLSQEQAAAAAALEARQTAASAEVVRLQDFVEELTAQLKREQALRVYGIAPTVAGAIQTCPVQGPHSFVDSFGAPRSGGRSHQGIDLMAPYGTPVVAVHGGNAVPSASSLGGLAVYVYHSNGDSSYYAHLASYGAAGSVSAGTVIGYVGSTGNAGSTNHLHFEYHPGGGGAVNPYAMLRAVCG